MTLASLAAIGGYIMGGIAVVAAIVFGLDRGKYTKLEITVTAQSATISAQGTRIKTLEDERAEDRKAMEELKTIVTKQEGIIEGKTRAMRDWAEAVADAGICQNRDCPNRLIPLLAVGGTD